MKILSYVLAGSVFLSGLGVMAADETSLNLNDLGFGASDTQASSDLQKTLDERRFYLKQHQLWGLVSAGALLGAISAGEGAEHGRSSKHVFLAGLATTSYFVSAYMGWKAPALKSSEVKGGTAWHRRLAWIHVPGMILTPIAGYMAAQAHEDGKKKSGLAKNHGDLALATAGALAVSMVLVSFEF